MGKTNEGATVYYLPEKYSRHFWDKDTRSTNVAFTYGISDTKGYRQVFAITDCSLTRNAEFIAVKNGELVIVQLTSQAMLNLRAKVCKP